MKISECEYQLSPDTVQPPEPHASWTIWRAYKGFELADIQRGP
jgi:hypothetical protein